ncbi:MAG: hypothetical protein TREMPRED_005174 [Tremellales sp. Tagirdzhanova-0007]|nr:MAG: hypothetical protein TREMPRED_005174 [Tremellales sp. Tagirdzhanova-0007]
MPLYLLRVSLDHLTFRLPSLLSIAQVFNFPLFFVSDDKFRSILIVELERDEDVEKLLDRATLIMSASRLYTQASSYDELHANLKQRLHLFEPDMDRTFKLSVECSHHKIPGQRHLRTIDSFSYIALKGRTDLRHPEVEFLIFEDYDWATMHKHEQRLDRDGRFRTVYFARRIGQSRARPLMMAHSVKSRAFYGNTSMDSEMGFLLAGQALPAPGKIIYDPFVGTGSLLYPCAHWGALVLGSDIDGRQMRGKAKGNGLVPGILRAAAQYAVQDRFLDCLTFDVTRGPLRRGGWVDAIVTDPPYGVRAGAKRSGKKATHKKPMLSEPFLLSDGTFAHANPGYIPPFRPYELAHLTLDLVLLARYLLVPKGRLVFFLPTVTEEYSDIDIPVVEGMRELKLGDGSVQDFGKWGRRLITMEKTATDDGSPPTFEDHELPLSDRKLPAHHDFRGRYFEKFASRQPMESPDDPLPPHGGAIDPYPDTQI